MTTTPPPASPAESDPLFQLLTDALRAGPGSPQWADALAKLRDGGVQGADEYKLILRAREDIELGRDYRKVSAGPGFTRKVLEGIEREGMRRTALPTATIVAILAGLVILGVIATVIVIMSRGGGGGGSGAEAAVEKLEGASLPVSVASGSMPGAFTGFIAKGDDAGGEVTTTTDIDAETAASVECEFVVPPVGGARTIQVFVRQTDKPFQEIGCDYSDGRVSVTAPGARSEVATMGTPGATLKIGIRFDLDTAIIEAGGRRLFAGPHGMHATPRRAGIRFRTASKHETIEVKSLSVARAAEAGGR